MADQQPLDSTEATPAQAEGTTPPVTVEYTRKAGRYESSAAPRKGETKPWKREARNEKREKHAEKKRGAGKGRMGVRSEGEAEGRGARRPREATGKAVDD